MSQTALTQEQKEIGVERLKNFLSISTGAKLVTYAAAAGAVYCLLPGDRFSILAGLFPAMANLINAIGGNLLAEMVKEVANRKDPSLQDIARLIEATLAQTKINEASFQGLQNLPTKRELYRVISILDEKQEQRFEDQTETILAAINELKNVSNPEIDEEAALERYLEWVATNPLYTTLQILGMAQPWPLGKIYTDVYLLDQQGNLAEAELKARERSFMQHTDPRQNEVRFAGVDLLQEKKRLFIVGQPGAGKTTFLCWLAVNVANGSVPVGKVPIYVALRAWNDFDGSFWDFLAQPLSLSGFPGDAENFVQDLLRQGQGLLLLDGLDEVLPARRKLLYQNIDNLAQMSVDNLLALTCRPYAEMRRFKTFAYAQMADFNSHQMKAFVGNWFSDAERGDTKVLWHELQRDENKPIRELVRTPLLLGLLCINYQETGAFPTKRHELYEAALDVVFTEWDETRGVKRNSLYGQLGWQKKRELLTYLGYLFFEREMIFIPEAELIESINSFWGMWRQELIQQQKEEYGQVYPPELPLKNVDGDLVIRDIAAQHGLLVQQADGYFSFPHLTMQEYFTARYIVDNEQRGVVSRLMSHVGDDRWREVFLLVAAMLDDATEFCNLYLQATNELILDDEAFWAQIIWAAEKGLEAEVAYKPAACRAFFLHLNLRLVSWRARDLIIALDPESNPDLNLDPDIDLAFIRANDQALFLARVLDRTLDLSLELDQALNSDTYIASAIYVAKKLGLFEMHAALQTHKASKDGSTLGQFYTKQASIKKTYRDQWDPYRLLVVTDTESRAALPLVISRLSSERVGLWRRYLEANSLLVYCLQVSYVPNRQELEDKILLPPDI